ncbi:primosomal protein N' [Campylobacter showae]|uniref:Replication restart protein PriA n=1 Tax=Campylobacter showae RM3277 TaxID=553219 RepID=C6RD68_9BACT|nr:primosomal protein N' [Campylobacter showae]EET80635.1 primosomal protein N' [Campylobacter showae RM3277]QCD49182.1 primosomal protein N' [Campylobacter showae]
MLYYQIIPSGLNLKPLTYCSDFKIPNFTQVLINIKNKKTIGYVLQSVAEPNFKTLEILEILPATLTPIQISLLKFISHYYVVNLSIAAGLFTPLEIEAPCLQNLTQAQILSDKNETNAKFDDSKELNLTTELNETWQSNLPENLNSGDYQENLKLNENVGAKLNFNNPTQSPKIGTNQSVAIEFFPKIPSLNQDQQVALNFAKSHKTSLIFGDTGSGKSEIYFSLIREYLLAGKQVLLLMPEISLTPQMTKRLKSYFGEKFGVWHSKITPKKRGEILQKFQSREINLIAGARSALFLPFSELGLIIVDEEHDDSYKSAQNPHYNARDLALFLASKFDIKVVLGSATPSVVSFKKQPHFRLRGTFFKSEKKFIYDESETGLSDVILGELAASFASGKQAVVFLPTRANFRYLSCRECGSTIKCPFCSVGMSFYKKRNLLKCQYCGFTTVATCSCEKCGSEMIEAKKIGTDELTDALHLAFPAARIEKFDRDEITTQNKLEKTLKAFNAGEIDALVGTQMLSKGHDYHNVDLAVIMGVDELLNFPDFRARERTLALAMQVAGRAGRSGEGRVVVQSRQREFFENFISDYDAFLAEEILAREPIYPPFARLLRVVVSEKSEHAAKQRLEICVAELENLRMAESSLEIVGHGKCAIEIMGGKYRFEILLRCTSHAPLIKAARICAVQGFDVDMDPINFS